MSQRGRNSVFVNFQKIAEKNSISYTKEFLIFLFPSFFFSLNVNFQRNPREVLKNIGEQLGIFRCIGTFLWEGIAIDGGGTRSNCERGSRISRNWIEVKTTLQFVQAWAVLNSFSDSRRVEKSDSVLPVVKYSWTGKSFAFEAVSQFRRLTRKRGIDFHLELEQKRKSSFPFERQERHLFRFKRNTFSAQIFASTSSKDNNSLWNDEKLRGGKSETWKEIEGI